MRELTQEDINRAKTFITMPSLCTTYALCEWIEALCADWERLNEQVTSDGSAA